MNNLELEIILKKYHIQSFGVCDFTRISTFLPCRNQEKIPNNAKSVIVCAFPYYVGEFPNANVCKYAMLPDYHVVLRKLLDEACLELSRVFNAQFVGFSDISALPEKECAVLSGLGVCGTNGLVIHPQYGSFFMIGEIVTNYAFSFTESKKDRCIECGRCIETCPVGAITKQGVDYTKCLSYVTQRKGELTEEEKQAISKNGLIWGCDCCQNCCPHNQNIPLTYLSAFLNDVIPVVTEESLPALMKTRAFGYRGKTLIKRNLSLINE